MSDRRILVTGATGFVGLRLLDQLRFEMREVVALHHRPVPAAVRERFGNSVTWRAADIAQDDLTSVVDGASSAIHLAAYVSHTESAADAEEMNRVNVVGTRRLAEACARGSVRRFVFVSSVAACETSDKGLVKEGGVPSSNYGLSKKRAEDLLLAMSSDQFRVTVLRPTALFGENHLGSMYELARAIHRGRFAFIGSGENRVDFYYIADFVEALLKAERLQHAGGDCYIANDAGCSQRELVSMLKAALGDDRKALQLPLAVGYAIACCLDLASAVIGRRFPLSRRRVRAMTRSVIHDGSRLNRAIGSGVHVGLAAGIRLTVAWYREAGLL
jgi:nucleoside-diphosphate-sugar epimerase